MSLRKRDTAGRPCRGHSLAFQDPMSGLMNIGLNHLEEPQGPTEICAKEQ